MGDTCDISDNSAILARRLAGEKIRFSDRDLDLSGVPNAFQASLKTYYERRAQLFRLH